MPLIIANGKNQAPSFKNLLEMAENLAKNGQGTEHIAILEKLAKSQLNHVQTEKILNTIGQRIGCNSKTLHKEYDLIQKNLKSTQDIALQLARQTLTDFYANGLHLKRNNDGIYYLFDKTHWRSTSKDTIKNNIQKIADPYLPMTNKGLAALTSEAMRCLDDLLASDDDLLSMTSALPPVVNCKNYTLWITENGDYELKPHNPLNQLIHCIEHNYDPDATCPIFDQTVLEIFSNSTNPQEMVRHFEEIMGYIISPKRNIAMFVLMIGHGNNGKSKLLETLQRLLGEKSILSDSIASFQKDKFATTQLIGKLLFCDDDVKAGITINDELIKKLSETKIISGRFPYGKTNTNFRNMAFPLLSSNGFPNTDDISYGMIRRAYLLPFDKQFKPNEDNKKLFPSIWENEMSGILNRAIQGLQRLIKRGKFHEPDDCIKSREEFFAHANPLYAFIEGCTIPNPDAKVSVKEFREKYHFWAKDQGINVKIQTKKFARTLRGLENRFNFKVTEANSMSKVAYPMIYGISVLPFNDDNNDDE